MPVPVSVPRRFRVEHHRLAQDVGAKNGSFRKHGRTRIEEFMPSAVNERASSPAITRTSDRSIRRGVWGREFAANYQLYIMMVAPLTFIIVFHYVPMYGAQIAFKEFMAVRGIWGSPWVGFAQFQRFFRAYQFRRVMLNTLEISLYSLVAGFPIPIILAVALNSTRMIAFKRVVQMTTYAPYFISTVVMVGIIIQFLSPRFGMVNRAIQALGMESVLFMGRPDLFSSVYVWSGVWQHAGWGTIIYLAALSSVDPSLHEAAIVDGATRLRRVVSIDIPAIAPTITILLILNLGMLMNVGFEKVLLMQNSLNLQRSEIISTFAYKVGLAGNLPQYSYGAAIGLFNAVINFALLLVVNQIAKKLSETSLF